MAAEVEELAARVRRLEDESAITRLVMTYGPSADAGLARLAGQLWAEDGAYDWDANGEPHPGSAGVEAMLRSDMHRGLMAEGVAHFGGPLMITVDGDVATALNYSLIMRFENPRFYLWRVSAVRWDFDRAGEGWKVTRRTNRLLDSAGAGSQLFETSLKGLFEEVGA